MITKKSHDEFSKADSQPIEFNYKKHPRIHLRPMYFELGFSPSPAIYGRYAVLNRLMKALDILPAEYGFLIWDVYRPRAVQAQLFEWMRGEIRKKYPHLNEQENYEETKKYISLPAKTGDPYCPPHLSGGAIDLTLCKAVSGEAFEMGTDFDDCTERAHRDYYNLQSHLSLEEKKIKERRELLRTLMEQVGFTSYQYEWWHFDLGNLLWSRTLNRSEVFGPLFGDDEWPKNLVSS